MKLLKMCEMKYGMIPEKKMFPIVTAILVILRRTLVQMRMMKALTHDSEAKVSFDSERFFVVVAKNVYLLYVTS